jgi:two-component system, LytTR family, sensor kinase
LIENSIKHGFAQQVGGGTICIRSRVDDEKLVLQVEDDGVGMEASENAADDGRPKVGMANVAERLRVLYPNTAWMSVAPRPGGGTVIALHLPYFLLTSDLEPAWVDSVIHEERSRTRR